MNVGLLLIYKPLSEAMIVCAFPEVQRDMETLFTLGLVMAGL